MRESNGIAIFTYEEDDPAHPAFRNLSTVSLGKVRFPFGFFIVDDDDDDRYVRPATEAERMQMLRKVFPDGPSETAASAEFCFFKDQGCGSTLCHTLRPHHSCFRGYDESHRQYACWCETIE